MDGGLDQQMVWVGLGWLGGWLSPICRLIGTGHDMTGSGCGTKAGLDLAEVAFISFTPPTETCLSQPILLLAIYLVLRFSYTYQGNRPLLLEC